MPRRRRSTRVKAEETEPVAEQAEQGDQVEQEEEENIGGQIDEPNEDEEVNEQEEEGGEEGDEDGDVEGEFGEFDDTPRRRGRPPGSKNKTTLARELLTGKRQFDDDEEDEDLEGSAPIISSRGRGRGRGSRWPGRGRGRAPVSSHLNTGPVDDDGRSLEVIDDEAVLPIDYEGEKKIDDNGKLLGGRDFRVRTFTVLGRGTRLYMLSTEPARCMGFRDSYLLFQKHRKLHKVIVNDEEKFDLIDRDIIPHSYKGRSIGIVTAKSIFREFGAKIVIGGKRIIDDYYETDAREAGFVQGEIADPFDKLPAPGEEYNKNQYVAWHGASSVYHTSAPSNFNTRAFIDLYKDHHLYRPKRKVIVTDENWMLEHSRAASQYNSELTQKRKQIWTRMGVYEAHTGLQFYPKASQPTKSLWIKPEDQENQSNEKKKVTIESVMYLPSAVSRTGLKDVSDHVFEDVEPEIKNAIRHQQLLEQQWEELK